MEKYQTIEQKIAKQKMLICRINDRIARNNWRIKETQELLDSEILNKENLEKKLQEYSGNSRQIIVENKKLLFNCDYKIEKLQFKLNGITTKNNSKTGEIITEKVGELFVREFLANELLKMQKVLEILEIQK